MKLVETAPGVTIPSRSRGTPFGSVILKTVLIVPSLAICADSIVIVSPGRTKETSFSSAKKALFLGVKELFEAAPNVTATRDATDRSFMKHTSPFVVRTETQLADVARATSSTSACKPQRRRLPCRTHSLSASSSLVQP